MNIEHELSESKFRSYSFRIALMNATLTATSFSVMKFANDVAASMANYLENFHQMV